MKKGKRNFEKCPLLQFETEKKEHFSVDLAIVFERMQIPMVCGELFIYASSQFANPTLYLNISQTFLGSPRSEPQ